MTYKYHHEALVQSYFQRPCMLLEITASLHAAKGDHGFLTRKFFHLDPGYHNRRQMMGNLAHKNASTQTWTTVNYKSKEAPRSSYQGASVTRRPASLTLNRQYIVAPDSVLGSEVSSKPHFPSSASNCTESRASDFLSSIREGKCRYFLKILDCKIFENESHLPQKVILFQNHQNRLINQ